MMEDTSFKLLKPEHLNLDDVHIERASTSNSDVGTIAAGEKHAGENENEVQLNKSARAKLLTRSRKQPVTNSIHTIRSYTPNTQIPLSAGIRYRSKTWCKPTSARQPLISASTFVRNLTRPVRKWSAPTALHSSYRRSWR